MALPCEGRDEWTLESTHDTTTDPGVREDAQLAQRRAQFTCYLKCPQRQACLDWATEHESQRDPEGRKREPFHIYGGLLARERTNLSKGLPLVGPAQMRWGFPKDHQVDQLLDPTYTAAGLADEWGMTFKSLKAMLADWLWTIRLEQADPAVMLHGVAAAKKNEETSGELTSTVRAA